MLQQQQDIGYGIGLARRAHCLLKRKRLAVWHAPEIAHPQITHALEDDRRTAALRGAGRWVPSVSGQEALPAIQIDETIAGRREILEAPNYVVLSIARAKQC
jgi:hypothetical protein